MTKKIEEEARQMTVDAVRELAGSVELSKAFERVWTTTSSVEDDDLSYFVSLESACIDKAFFFTRGMSRYICTNSGYAA